MSIQSAAETYFASVADNVEKGKLSKASQINYGNAVRDFTNFCVAEGVLYLDQITAKTLADHETWLYKNLPQKRTTTTQKRANTMGLRFSFIQNFLDINGIKACKDKKGKVGDPGLMEYGAFPRQKKSSDRTPYEEEEIKAMLAAAESMLQPTKEDETPWAATDKHGKERGGFTTKQRAQTALDLIHFALKTGFRNREIAHAEWDDINWRYADEGVVMGALTTGPKPGYNWTTKSKKSRFVTIPALLERLRTRQANQSPISKLIFPNDDGRPDNNLVLYLKEIVLRVKSEGGKVKGEIGWHRVRYTAGDLLSIQPGIATGDVQEFLGHSDPQTTALYVRPNKQRQAKATKTAFRSFGD